MIFIEHHLISSGHARYRCAIRMRVNKGHWLCRSEPYKQKAKQWQDPKISYCHKSSRLDKEAEKISMRREIRC